MDTAAIDDLTARITGDAPVVRVQKDAGLWARHPEDYYTEPSWCSERLFHEERFFGTVVDPFCGSGRILRAAKAAQRTPQGQGIITVLGYDKVNRSPECAGEEDFLTSDYETDNIVSNPPFRLCSKANAKNGLTEDFAYVKKALATAERKVALLLPLPWLTGADKGEWLETTPLSKVLIITPRPSMPPGPVIEAGLAPGGGTEDFAWMIWDHAHKGPPTLGWLNRDG